MKHGEFPMKHAKQCVFYMFKKVTMYHGKITKMAKFIQFPLFLMLAAMGFPWFP